MILRPLECPRRELNVKVGIEVESTLLQNGSPRSMVNVIPDFGKSNPLSISYSFVKDLGTMSRQPATGNLHWDNALAEMVTEPVDASISMRTLYQELRNASLKKIKQVLGLSQYDRSIVLADMAGTTYSSGELENPEHKVAGCSPSKNIYTSDSHVIRYTSNERYGGLHLNVDFKGDVERYVRCLDKSLGLLSVVLSSTPEIDRNRRTLYGRAGEHRTPDFGVEYRTLPASMATTSSTINLDVLAKHARRLAVLVEDGLDIPFDEKIKTETAQAAIDRVDQGLALSLLKTGGVI